MFRVLYLSKVEVSPVTISTSSTGTDTQRDADRDDYPESKEQRKSDVQGSLLHD